MNLITLILIIAILFGMTDFLTERYPRLQRDVYYIALFVITFLFSIKYYYGPDIASYVPFYENLPSITELLSHPDEIDYDFEIGYALFCGILKSCGVSFYWLTVILTVLYFTVIHLLFRKIDHMRSFALAILVVLDFNVVCYEFRQCLSVIIFLLMILCLDNKKHLWAVVCAAVTILCHKSGVVAVVPTLAYYLISHYKSMQTVLQVLLVLLVILFLLPVVNLSLDFVESLPLPNEILHSITHHLSLGRQFQVIFLVYVTALLCMVHYIQYCKSRTEIIAAAAIIGLLFIVLFYQYYYLLNRLRSYFTPLILLFVFRLVQNAERDKVRIPYGQLIKQFLSVLVIAYMVHSTISLHRGAKVLKNKVNDTCTVFDLIDNRASDVQKSQMKKARLFWEQDYMQHENNKL